MFTFFTPGVINEKWMDYQATWPLDLSCCIIVIILDFIRRVRRMDFHVHDAAPMFSMSLLQFTVACLRAVETFFYYNVLTRISLILSKVNKVVKKRAIMDKQAIPLTFCLEPPKVHFAISMLGMFMSVLDITLILDYMDPI
ncbi:hypothetical protein FBUS_06309 [Fasciolopsis buskii]|uniref:Uncharacterized protein n=1 Tax=Fasciolopsis buskii TaxID=27845 RepID=A0A8E0VM29_9TREM|nr:hypothetical protein FBUS_06309 [Fasciolopsis buski]